MEALLRQKVCERQRRRHTPSGVLTVGQAGGARSRGGVLPGGALGRHVLTTADPDERSTEAITGASETTAGATVSLRTERTATWLR
jgi:hypothetical protein